MNFLSVEFNNTVEIIFAMEIFFFNKRNGRNLKKLTKQNFR